MDATEKLRAELGRLLIQLDKAIEIGDESFIKETVRTIREVDTEIHNLKTTKP